MAQWLLLAQNGADVAAWAGGFMILWFIVGLAGLAFWIWALVDAIKNPALDSTMRIVWVLVILFTSILGAVIYLAVGRSSGQQRLPG